MITMTPSCLFPSSCDEHDLKGLFFLISFEHKFAANFARSGCDEDAK